MITISKENEHFKLWGMSGGELEFCQINFNYDSVLAKPTLILRCCDHDINGLQSIISDLPIDNKIFELANNKFYDFSFSMAINPHSFNVKPSPGTSLKFIQKFKKFEFYSEINNPLYIQSITYQEDFTKIILVEHVPSPLFYEIIIPLGDIND